MKTIIIAILTLTSTLVMAQKSVTWIGGTPGNESNWNDAKNWSNNSVPNEFSDVIILSSTKCKSFSPIIKEEVVELNSIRIDNNALLSIDASAKLIIHGYSTGLTNENLDIKGSLLVRNEMESDNEYVTIVVEN